MKLMTTKITRKYAIVFYLSFGNIKTCLVENFINPNFCVSLSTPLSFIPSSTVRFPSLYYYDQ